MCTCGIFFVVAAAVVLSFVLLGKYMKKKFSCSTDKFTACIVYYGLQYIKASQIERWIDRYKNIYLSHMPLPPPPFSLTFSLSVISKFLIKICWYVFLRFFRIFSLCFYFPCMLLNHTTYVHLLLSLMVQIYGDETTFGLYFDDGNIVVTSNEQLVGYCGMAKQWFSFFSSLSLYKAWNCMPKYT